MVVFTSCDLLTGGGSITPPAELPAVPASITAEPKFVDLDTGVLYTGFTTDGSGAVNLKAPFNREKSVGYTLMYDVDGSNSLSDGDIVQGDGAANTWGVFYWNDLIESSFYFNTTQLTNPWHEYSLVSGD